MEIYSMTFLLSTTVTDVAGFLQLFCGDKSTFGNTCTRYKTYNLQLNY